ncbi:MAG: D-glycerate dehydrogenase [Candidatus Acidiferrales bacterium]
MPRPRVYVTHALFEAPRAQLVASCDAEFWSGSSRPTREELQRAVAAADGLVSLLTDRIDDALLAAAPRLRIVANVAVGYDNLDLAALSRRKIAATNTPGVLDETTADLAWALLLAVARRIVEADALARSGKWQMWDLDQFCGADVWGKTLGVVGFGRIGQAVARRAQGFRMRVIYANGHRVSADVEKELRAEYRTLDALVAESDFISLHVPLNDTTRHMISAPQFAAMKPAAYLINTSRGPVIDEAALIAALATGRIAGAALDVYEHEPKIPDGLRRPNVVMTPHIGSASIETRTKMAMIAVENVIEFFAGRRPPTILNPEVLPESTTSAKQP